MSILGRTFVNSDFDEQMARLQDEQDRVVLAACFGSCAQGRHDCPTPTRCIAAIKPVPLFCDDPLASQAVGWCLALGFVAAISAAVLT